MGMRSEFMRTMLWVWGGLFDEDTDNDMGHL